MTTTIAAPTAPLTRNVRLNRSRYSVHVVDLTNAGKRGTCTEIVLYDIDCVREPTVAKLLDSTLDAFEKLATNPNYDYANIASRLREIHEVGSSFGVKLAEREIKAVKVAPAEFETIKIVGLKVEIEAEWDSFCIRDLTDTNNLPTAIPPEKASATAVKLFRKFAADNRDKLATFTFNEVLRAMKAAGIGHHHYLAMD